MRATLPAALLTAAAIALAACGSDAQERRGSFAEKTRPQPSEERPSTQPAPPKPLSKDADIPTGEPEKDKEKDQRGNTPPGMDRSGGGPASGAIVDPSGAATK